MRSERDYPGASKSGAAGTSFWLILLAVSVIVFGANTGFATWQGSRYAGASTSAADIQVLSQQLVAQSHDAIATGASDAFATLRTHRADISSKIEALQSRFGGNVGVSGTLKQLESEWTTLGGHVDAILASESAASELAASATAFTDGIPGLQRSLNEIAQAMIVNNASAAQVEKVLDQIVAVGEMAEHVENARNGRADSESAAEALALAGRKMDDMLRALQEGDSGMGIVAVRNPNAVSAVRQVQSRWDELRAQLDTVLSNVNNMSVARTASEQLMSGVNGITDSSRKLLDSFSAFGSAHDTRNFWLGVIPGLLSLFSIVGLAISLKSSQRRQQELRYQTQHEFNSRNQQAIMRLLDEISSLGEGDLTVKASVTEDMTGAIADAVNYAVEELRNLVTTINDTSEQVASSSQETQATAKQLAEAANYQAEQISAASERINEIASSIKKVSRNSTESAEVAQRSVNLATEGAGVVRDTIKGMDQIRDQIQETSKRIKRLGESSQEIGSIVELINDISEQTNILALNAAVQAASAGEAGRGFAVVADEVQRLAERTSSATRRIEGLVQTIQTDTNEAVNSMEQTTAEVVSGARAAEDAGIALAEIERVSRDLNELIQSISGAAEKQSMAAADITKTMELIRQITTQTSHGASQTADSIGYLTQLATDLRRSVADFKLPE